MEIAQLEQLAQEPEPYRKPFDGDEDFINYMHTFAQQIQFEMQNTPDKSRVQYYRGMLYALKSISQVYETLLKGDFI